jgi:predicted metal-dependent phosphoesterase TrpH
MKFADLHLHTCFSDGTYTPEELILSVAKVGLAAIAVVDHDTTAGLAQTIEIAKTKDIEVLPGVELSAEYEGTEIHILGYLIDYRSPALNEKLDSLRRLRVERIYKMADKLKDMGVRLKPEVVFDIAQGGMPGRLHVARAMVKEKLVRSSSEAFQRYIGDKCPGYVCGFKFTPAESIRLIKDSGGIPVLAHPFTLHNDELIHEFVGKGLMGLEVYYPEHSQSMTNFYLKMAKELNLLVTGGSDCHGNAKPEVKIGSIKIPYELVEKLKDAKKNK